MIAISKPVGLPSQDEKSGAESAHRQLEHARGESLYVIHRIDRPASGVLLFARNHAAAAHLSRQFAERTVEKRYLAIVSLPVDPPAGFCEHRLLRNAKTNKSSVAEKGKVARLSYRVAGRGERYAMLEVELLTGRHHQIRAQLSAVGHPIRGDLKYGAPRSQQGGGIALHAVSIRCVDPGSGKEAFIVASPPNERLWNDLYTSYEPGAPWPEVG